MLSVAALVTGLFGTRLPHAHLHGRALGFVVAALALFAGSAVLAIMVASPRRQAWEFSFRLGELRQRVDAGHATPTDVTSNLADWAEEARSENRPKMERLY